MSSNCHDMFDIHRKLELLRNGRTLWTSSTKCAHCVHIIIFCVHMPNLFKLAENVPLKKNSVLIKKYFLKAYPYGEIDVKHKINFRNFLSTVSKIKK